MIKFCITHNKSHKHIENIGYQPVGLGEGNFPKNWIRDNTGDNISFKNQYYDMYTFHYWLWKNKISNYKEGVWVNFSTYRRFWKNQNNLNNSNLLKENILQDAPEEWKNFETILSEPTDLRKIKLSKILKKGKKLVFKNPKLLFNKDLRNIKFHFDLMHLEGNLKKALTLIDEKERYEFTDFLNNNYEISLWNLFCCNSPKLLNQWYNSVFTWLFKCEKIFGFKNLKGYETGRIYAYLAERYLPYWFKKYSKTLVWPIYFNKDID